MRKKIRSLRRGCFLLLTLVMCMGPLQLPALAAEDAHVHNEDGWSCQRGALNCTLEEHAHADECWDWVCIEPETEPSCEHAFESTLELIPAAGTADTAVTADAAVETASAWAANTLPASVDLTAEEDEASNLQSAITDGEGGYTLSGGVTGRFTIPAGTTFELDLNGHTLSGTGGGYAIVNNGTLLLKNGAVKNEAGCGVANAGAGTLVMNDVTINSYDCAVTGAGGTLTLDNCAVTVTAPSGGQPYGVYGQESCTILLENTTIHSEFVGVYTNGGKTVDVTITGGSIHGSSCAAINQWGVGAITVSSCTLTSDNSWVVEHNSGALELKDHTSLYSGGRPGTIGGGSAKKNITMDATVVIDESSRIHTPWTDYVTSVTEADYAADAATETVSIKTPAGLAWWAKHAGSSFAGYTVKIENDLDMGGYEWTPISNGSQYAGMTLDGQGHTISGLLVPGQKYGGGFIGDTAPCDFTIKNLTFDGATVGSAGSGNIVGVVLGYANGTITLENVHVANSRVSGFGKIGGLAGMTEKGDTLVLKNCSVTNTTVSGAYNCGGLLGLNQGAIVDADTCAVTAVWEPAAASYACYNGTAEFSNTDDSEVNLPVKGTFYVGKYPGKYLGYYAAWGKQYTDYDQYYNKDAALTEYASTLLFVGLCHGGELHTHTNLTGTHYEDTGDGVTHNLVCDGCGAVLESGERHTFVDNVCEKCHAEKYVARIGGTKYKTIQEAVDAVPENGTALIEMINDSDRSAVIPAGKTITLNVPEGITLTNKSMDGSILTNNGGLILTGKGHLDVYMGGYAVYNFGNADLNGCTFTTYTGDYVVWNRGTMEINHARILKEKDASRDAVVNGREAPNAQLTIRYCEITESAGGCCVGNLGGTTIILDGIFTAALPVENRQQNPNVDQDSTLIIEGGKFIKDAGPGDGNGAINSVDTHAVLLIKGGDFYSTNTERPVILSNARATVSGGTFFRGGIFDSRYYEDTRCTVTDPGTLYAFKGKDYDGETDAVRWRTGTAAMRLDKASLTLSLDGTEALTPTITPADAARTVTWSSDNTSVATVNEAGVVTAHAPGTANITCTVTFQTARKNESGTAFEVKPDVKTPACAVTVTAAYTLSYNANGANVANLPANQSGIGTVTISSQRPTRAGYTFRGWAAGPSGGAVYQPGGSLTLRGHTTLYAVWTANSGGIGGTDGSSGTGGGSVTITDPLVPLAGDLRLNREDHFGYIKGYDDGTIRPNNPLTRAQVATIYYRLLTDLSREIYFRESSDFSDVPDGFWACKAISTLAAAGVINGFQDGTFRPNEYITRAQFTAMTVRFEGVIPGLDNPFADVSENHWARDDIAFAAFQGWISGDGNFRPQENITRVEAMEFINNVLGRRVDGEGLIDGHAAWSDIPMGDPNYYVAAEAATSHSYTRRTEGQLMENWTGLREDPVWDE